jgi:secreted PhoX family phosphatase
METEGELRGSGMHFYSCPAGAEMCGPYFTPNDETLFLAVQHPADDGEEWTEFNQPSTFENPSTRWPDFQDGMPARPSVVSVVKIGGGKIA